MCVLWVWVRSPQGHLLSLNSTQRKSMSWKYVSLCVWCHMTYVIFDYLCFLFLDWFSHWTWSNQSWMWFPVFSGFNKVWGSVHLVRKVQKDTLNNVTLRWSVVCWRCVFLRGKGDYHRLGHGSDDHVRRPRQVQGLQGKKVIAIATGSLHCVCCTEDGTIKTLV